MLTEIHHAREKAFTLIELSIVLVIIGLIVGGILVGRDLIAASAVRAQIAQIDKYNAAVNTFKTKYGYLPGDIKEPDASRFGFVARGQYAGEGDGNGVIQGVWNDNQNAGCCNAGIYESAGEAVEFWVDLSTARLIDGGFKKASTHTVPSADITGTGLDQYFPQGKIGRGNYLYVWSGGYTASVNTNGDSVNYFGLLGLASISSSYPMGNPALSVAEANAMDSKIDDGLPQSGTVQAMYINTAFPFWAGGSFGQSTPYTTATPASINSCFDNGNVGGATQKYSMSTNNGAYINCTVSFKFQ